MSFAHGQLEEEVHVSGVRAWIFTSILSVCCASKQVHEYEFFGVCVCVVCWKVFVWNSSFMDIVFTDSMRLI